MAFIPCDISIDLGLIRAFLYGDRESGSSGSSFLHPSSLDGFTVTTGEESTVTADENECRENTGYNDGGSHNIKAFLGSKLTEAHSESYCATVSSSSYDSTDRPSGRGVNVRHDSISSSFSSLNEAGKYYQYDNGKSETLGTGEDQDHDSFNDKTDSLPNQTTSHSHLSVELVRSKASKSTGKQVHPSENRCDGGGRFSRKFKFVLEVSSSGIVHGELYSKAASVLNEK